MSLEFLELATAKELEQFRSVCNELLSHTFIVRTFYRSDEGRVDNPDYLFLMTHYEEVREYLGYLDWEVHRDDLHGYFYVVNKDEANHYRLSHKETVVLLALRQVYEDNVEELGLEHDVACTVRDVLEIVVTDYAIFSTHPNMNDIKQILSLFEKFSVIQRLDGKLNNVNCRITILPTICTVVAQEKFHELAKLLKKGELDDEKDAETVID